MAGLYKSAIVIYGSFLEIAEEELDDPLVNDQICIAEDENKLMFAISERSNKNHEYGTLYTNYFGIVLDEFFCDSNIELTSSMEKWNKLREVNEKEGQLLYYNFRKKYYALAPYIKPLGIYMIWNDS